MPRGAAKQKARPLSGKSLKKKREKSVREKRTTLGEPRRAESLLLREGRRLRWHGAAQRAIETRA
jgi:hypothetical protein